MPDANPAVFMSRRRFAVSAATTAALFAAAKPLTAQDASPAVDADLAIETVASGLDSPRFLAIDGDAVYFTEAGTGGEIPVFEIAGEGTPAPDSPVSATGLSGKLSRLDADGTVTVLVDDFRSYIFGSMGEIVGPAGIALDGHGNAFVAVGAPGPFISTIDRTGEEAVLYTVDLATGEKAVIADLGQYEIDHNPDPAMIDSNPYGLALADGVVYVADAGGNTVIAVDAETGESSTFAVTGGLDAPFMAQGNPLRMGRNEIDSVPGSVVAGPDGRLYVSFVTGAPFPAGMAPVWAYSPDGTQAVYTSGLTMIGDLAFASDGTLYACVISADLIGQAPGMVVRISPDGDQRVIVDNLIVPNGIAFDANDDLYILTKASGFPGGGELVRVSGVTSAEGRPLTPPDETGDASPVAGASEPVHVVLHDISFEPSELTIPANTDVTFTFENRGVLVHDFLIADPLVFSGILRGGESSTQVVNLPPGTYFFYCSQTGHRISGMVGTLTVE